MRTSKLLTLIVPAALGAGCAPAVCLPPTPTDPIGPVFIPNPLAPIATPTNPGTFTLSNGNLTLLSDRVPVLRTLTQP